ncbi:hypothetical protein ES703_103559 [subsurface metagenome]
MEPWHVALVVFGVIAIICAVIKIRCRERK